MVIRVELAEGGTDVVVPAGAVPVLVPEPVGPPVAVEELLRVYRGCSAVVALVLAVQDAGAVPDSAAPVGALEPGPVPVGKAQAVELPSG